jgi:hypothetical protein
MIIVSSRSALLLLLACGLPLSGCNKEQKIEYYQVPKTAAEPVAADDSDVPPTAIHWTVPAGWRALPGKAGDIRFASFEVAPDHPQVEMTVVPLGGDGGTLLSNVVRWEKEIGCPISSEADLPKFVTQTNLAGSPAELIDLTGPATADHPAKRTVCAIVPHGDQTWFFKLSGAADVVSAQKDNFDQFVRSIKFDQTEAAAPAEPAGPVAAAPSSDQPLAYQAPGGWEKEAETNQFRVVAFRIASAGGSGEMVVTQMARDSGTLVENVNRWRGEVGLEPVSDLSATPPTALKVDGSDAMMWDISGAASGDQPARRIMVVLVPRGPAWWFFKLSGPSDLVAGEKEMFLGFLTSVRFQDQGS